VVSGPEPPAPTDTSTEAGIAEAARAAAVEPNIALKNVKDHWWSRKKPALTDDEIQTANERLKLRLRKWLAIIAGCAALAQVATADIVFILYASHGRHWNVPTAAIQAWLAATVVQVIGVVLVITRSLFPATTDTQG
jgi:hypothetical protein